MLDNETKSRINTARDILVGKVPDPKSQVEQITIALIYKFMDDMDKEAVDFGGEATFFTGEYEKYSWTKIFDPKIGGNEMLNLYSEAIIKLNINPNIPQLFRDIFKNAYLPYRDPETLKMFLKTINEFRYDHSEMLGDAFEYLLSVLGSQGDAGQFRTPRHIIDFMVQVLNPQKSESICDPACGTAGFLISSYKHIVDQNTKKTKGDLLTPDDRKRMMQNFVGYDISPDMVRLSLVNLYLHGFITPKIYEYDTLSSVEKWNEHFDVFIANPPFMTPKGGIKPHKKFTVQAKKSEILFVDYMTEHLLPNGRAAIVVPDGIVANSPSAYKKLREYLINENILYSVISLPSGIFSPYSDVKTSILLFDKKLAKNSNNIFFLEVKADGFQLGSTRKPIKENNLPLTLDLLNKYKDSLLNNTEFITDIDTLNWHIVAKSTILDTPAVSLSGKRYKDDIHLNSPWPIINLDTQYLIELKEKVNQTISTVWSVSNTLGFIPSSDYFGKQVASDDIKNYKKILPNYLAYNPARINVGSIALNESDQIGCVSPMYVTFKVKDEQILNSKYLLLLLKSKMGIKQIRKFADGAVRQTLSFDNLKFIQIPLPPITEQERIVGHFIEIDRLQNLINEQNDEIKNEIISSWGVKEEEIELEEIIETDDLEVEE
ncbi:MAG: N-6 DNA methylase [Paludibacter sp.]|nr:N-6 DNA methylase [Paludibacter sp.]